MGKLLIKEFKYLEVSKMVKSKLPFPKERLITLLFKVLLFTMDPYHVNFYLTSETTYEDYTQMKKNWGSHQELIKARK